MILFKLILPLFPIIIWDLIWESVPIICDYYAVPIKNKLFHAPIKNKPHFELPDTPDTSFEDVWENPLNDKLPQPFTLPETPDSSTDDLENKTSYSNLRIILFTTCIFLGGIMIIILTGS